MLLAASSLRNNGTEICRIDAILAQAADPKIVTQFGQPADRIVRLSVRVSGQNASNSPVTI